MNIGGIFPLSFPFPCFHLMSTVHEIDGRFVVAIPFDRGGFLTPGKDGEAYYGRTPDLKMGYHYAHLKDALKRAKQLFPEAV